MSKPWLPWLLLALVIIIVFFLLHTAILQTYPSTPAAVLTALPCSAGARYNTLTGALCATTPSYTFTKVLKPGSTGPDVKALQQLLNTNPYTKILGTGIGSPGKESTYYGPATMLAVGKFQLLYRALILTPVHLTKPTGIVGASTLKQLNAVELALARTKSSPLATTLPQTTTTSVITQTITGGGSSGGGGGGYSSGGSSCTAPSINTSLTAKGSIGADFIYTISADNSPTSFSASDLLPGTAFTSPTISGTPTTAGTFSMTISATNSCGTDNETLVVTISTPTLNFAPTGLGTSAAANDAINISWTDLPGETSFAIERSTDNSTFTQIATTTQSTTLYQDTGLADATTYYYRIRGYNSIGYSPYSSTASANTTVGTVTKDANGFTVLTPSGDTTVIYVSSSGGSDSNDGLTPEMPVKTISRAVALFPTGHPAWMLLKRGDVFSGDPVDDWELSGNSSTSMSLIGAYGTGARPIISGTLTSQESGVNITWASNVAIIGLNLYDSTADPSSPDYTGEASYAAVGIKKAADGQNILIEDCIISFWNNGIVLGPANQVVVRRNVVMNNYNGQGFIIGESNDILLEENVFDHNGWLGSRDSLTTGASIFDHNVYIQYNNANMTFRGNITANASSHGAQIRPGGVVQNNLFVSDPISLLIATSTNTEHINQSTSVTGNMILEGNDINTTTPRGEGMDIQNITDGLVDNNVIAHFASAYPASNGSQNAIDIGNTTDVTVSNNIIYDWNTAHFPGINEIIDNGTGTVETNNTIDGTGYTNPDLGVGDYNASIGGTNSEAAYLTFLESRPGATWNSSYSAEAAINFIREGFNLEPLTFVTTKSGSNLAQNHSIASRPQSELASVGVMTQSLIVELRHLLGL